MRLGIRTWFLLSPCPGLLHCSVPAAREAPAGGSVQTGPGEVLGEEGVSLEPS